MSEKGKMAAGRKAAELIAPGMIVGLGSGTTAAHFIRSLIERCKGHFKVRAVSSSHASATLARQGGIDLIDINEAPHIDLTVDGADEIDSKKRMIKGGGGAHTREKILASASREMIVIVDESKCVKQIGTQKLPIEILPFGSEITRHKIAALGFKGNWRMNQDGRPFTTENGNLLLDLHFPSPPPSPEELDCKIRAIVGVVETGFFFHLAGRVIVGFDDGRTEIR